MNILPLSTFLEEVTASNTFFVVFLQRSGWQRPERAESTQPRALPWVLMCYIYAPCKGKSKYTPKSAVGRSPPIAPFPLTMFPHVNVQCSMDILGRVLYPMSQKGTPLNNRRCMKGS